MLRSVVQKTSTAHAPFLLQLERKMLNASLHALLGLQSRDDPPLQLVSASAQSLGGDRLILLMLRKTPLKAELLSSLQLSFQERTCQICSIDFSSAEQMERRILSQGF